MLKSLPRVRKNRICRGVADYKPFSEDAHVLDKLLRLKYATTCDVESKSMSKEYGKLYSKVLGAAASDSMNMDKHAEVLLLPTIILRKGKWDPEKIKKLNHNEQNRLIKARIILYQSGPAGRRDL
jgi:hypothetical protein